jgi:amicyanin
MRRVLAALAVAFLVLFQAPSPAAAASFSVQIENYAFAPSSITVDVGDTITWTNDDTAPHTITTSSGPQTLSSPYLSKGQSWSFTFTTPGTYSYYCAVHPYMRAQVIVRAPASATRRAVVTHAATSAAPEPQRTYVRYTTSHAAAAPVRLPSTKAASPSASASPISTGSPATQVEQQSVADSSNIRTLSPVLLLGGLTAAIAVFCLLLIGSRAGGDSGGD